MPAMNTGGGAGMAVSASSTGECGLISEPPACPLPGQTVCQGPQKDQTPRTSSATARRRGRVWWASWWGDSLHRHQRHGRQLPTEAKDVSVLLQMPRELLRRSAQVTAWRLWSHVSAGATPAPQECASPGHPRPSSHSACSGCPYRFGVYFLSMNYLCFTFKKR